MNGILSLDEAREATSVHHALWTDITLTAWARWQEFQIDATFATVAQTFDSAARFHFLNRLICGGVEAKTDAVRFNVGGAGILLQPVGENAFVRFKHVNGSDLRPRAYATDQQVALISQEYIDPIGKQLLLEGFVRPRTLLTQGYTLNNGEDAIDQIVIVCHGPEFLYYYDLQSNEKAEVMMFPGIEPKPPRVLSALIAEPESQIDPPDPS